MNFQFCFKLFLKMKRKSQCDIYFSRSLFNIISKCSLQRYFMRYVDYIFLIIIIIEIRQRLPTTISKIENHRLIFRKQVRNIQAYHINNITKEKNRVYNILNTLRSNDCRVFQRFLTYPRWFLEGTFTYIFQQDKRSLTYKTFY